MTRTYQCCTRCIMDTTDPLIQFDEMGRCNHCTRALTLLGQRDTHKKDDARNLEGLIDRIRTDGRGKSYDCVAGISGGVDSSTVLMRAKRLGLRPLAVHFDNGWNSELAVDNIHRLLEAFELDLDTLVVDWEEFRDLQLAFLKASVPNVELPTDHGIRATLYRAAAREGVRYILTGGNLNTEVILPRAWGHDNGDLLHLKAIHRAFGTTPLRTMPTMGITRYAYNTLVRKIYWVPLLELTGYDKAEATRELMDQIGWRDYGGKHYESVWTRFFQGYYLPRKFGFDKRLAHLSTLICSGGMTREAAQEKMKEPIYPEHLLEQDRQFVIKKFGITAAEFDALMAAPPRLHEEFPTNTALRDRLAALKRRLVRGAW